jgi:hypothetical protein
MLPSKISLKDENAIITTVKSYANLILIKELTKLVELIKKIIYE